MVIPSGLKPDEVISAFEKVSTMQYTVLIHPAEEGGFWAEMPALPDCFTQGNTIEETLKNAGEAIESHLVGLREEGQEVPDEDGLVIARVDIAA